MTALPLNEPDKARELLDAYGAAGVNRIVCAVRYRTLTEYASTMAALASVLNR